MEVGSSGLAYRIGLDGKSFRTGVLTGTESTVQPPKEHLAASHQSHPVSPPPDHRPSLQRNGEGLDGLRERLCRVPGVRGGALLQEDSAVSSTPTVPSK